MADTVRIRDLFINKEDYADQEITVAAWARQLRVQKNIAFLELNDGSIVDDLQVVVKKKEHENYAILEEQYVGTAFEVTGKFILTPKSQQPFELQAKEFKVVGESDPNYPIQNKEHSLEFLRSQAHLRARTKLFTSVFRIRSEAALALHEFFHKNGFMYVHTPIITTSDAEGAGEMFKVTTIDPANPPLDEDGKVDYSQDFFHKPTYLTVSGQLNAEAYAQAFSKVYTFGPTFRAEHSNTQRHAAEFWMLEPEIAFADLNDVMNLAEAMMKYVINYILDNCYAELEYLNENVYDNLINRLENLRNSDFKRMTYTEAIEVLENADKDFDYDVSWGSDLQTEHERYLSEEYVGGPVFVTDYPKDIKAFYMHINEDGKTVAAVDLLVPEVGEIIGGSQREERLDVLLEEIKARGMKPENYDWYMELRKYGSTPHGGFGLGFERLIMYLTGMSNIRDVLPFPRTTGSAEF